ncbi:hypothetical protein [Corynebacterium glyciniphilum]|uniref:hypothetical protein n=1 Tax=Corynebacterium glyciniphilum TaxID=1404244 RepID=UPI00265544DD|nr:hypothetical protein [Corynebacterium glyciniphilum]MDN6706407.1 hypothetical protein [Corynebacterium glyciniphilum]
MSTLPATLSVPDAALLIGMPHRTLNDRVVKGTDGYGAIVGPPHRIPTKAILDAVGMTRTEAGELLDELKEQKRREDEQSATEGAAA